jgi:hypothetical protein
MKLTNILKTLMEDVDPNAMSSANALLLVDKLRSNAELMDALSQLQLPTDKYKAIIKFASLIGIPEDRFEDFMRNIKMQVQKNAPAEEE